MSTGPLVAAILGAGSIGRAFAIVFARAGQRVRLFDPDPAQLAAAPARIASRLGDLSAYGLLDDAPGEVLSRIATSATVATCVEGADYIQECGPENLALKRALLATVDAVAAPAAIVASASSAIPISHSAHDLRGRARMLVAHPANPPFLIAVIELVPAPFTDPATVERAAAIMETAGMTPIFVKREVEGFVYNRLQGALLREAYCLVRDGIAGVDDVDTLVREGLGLRWSVVGPFETVDLNTQGGIASHAAKMGPAYARMGAERGQDDPWTPDLVDAVTGERRRRLPLSAWDERVAWRDRRLMSLIRHRRRDTEEEA